MTINSTLAWASSKPNPSKFQRSSPISALKRPSDTSNFLPFPFATRTRGSLTTRIAYYHAIGQFLDWCQRAGFRGLEDIEPITVAAYVEQHPGSPATIKQHMSAIRMLFSWLTEKGILAPWPESTIAAMKRFI